MLQVVLWVENGLVDLINMVPFVFIRNQVFQHRSIFYQRCLFGPLLGLVLLLLHSLLLDAPGLI